MVERGVQDVADPPVADVAEVARPPAAVRRAGASSSNRRGAERAERGAIGLRQPTSEQETPQAIELTKLYTCKPACAPWRLGAGDAAI